MGVPFAAVATNREPFAGLANAQTAPIDWLSSMPPIRAVWPLAESASLKPNAPAPISPLPVSFDPRWVQAVPVRANTHAAPVSALSTWPPMSASVPSPDKATVLPNQPLPVSPEAVSLGPCWLQFEPALVKIHAPPRSLLSCSALMRAVSPFADSATPPPNAPAPRSSLAVSFWPCCVQVEPDRLNTQAAPTPWSSFQPPISAVRPSPVSETRIPKPAAPCSSFAVSFGPCCVQVELERSNTQTAPIPPASWLPPTSRVDPSSDSASRTPNDDWPVASVGVSFAVCVQLEPTRVKIHAAPAQSSPTPAIAAVAPSAESATALPNERAALSPEGVSFEPSWLQVDRERLKIQTAPLPSSSLPPPMSAVLPAAERATA